MSDCIHYSIQVIYLLICPNVFAMEMIKRIKSAFDPAMEGNRHCYAL